MKKVLVVGAGPVGLAMALELHRLGVPCRLVDKGTTRSEHSKALVVWPRTLEHLDRIGLADSFVAAGQRIPGMRILASSRLLAHIQIQNLPSPFPFALGLPQSETERLLEAHLRSLGGQVERGVECVGVSQTRQSVQATLQSSNATETPEFDWLIGCDGARSVVRHQMCMAFEGQQVDTFFQIADVTLTGVSGPDARLYWSPDGVLMLFPLGPQYRVVVNSAPGEVTLEGLQALVDQRGPGGIRLLETTWTSQFGVQERQVTSYRCGRVFLAGDAAHVHSPVGGQGMNTGLQDAFNLAWKLARSPDPYSLLLESYTGERHPVGRQVLRGSGRMLRLATLSDTWAQAVRNLVVGWLASRDKVQQMAREQLSELSIRYACSPVNGQTVRFKGGVRAGDRAPDGPLRDGRRLFEALRGELFAVVGFQAPARLLDHVRADWRVAVLEAGGGLEALYGMTAPGLVLIRPDGYVGVAADEQVSTERLAFWFERLGVPRRD